MDKVFPDFKRLLDTPGMMQKVKTFTRHFLPLALEGAMRRGQELWFSGVMPDSLDPNDSWEEQKRQCSPFCYEPEVDFGPLGNPIHVKELWNAIGEADNSPPLFLKAFRQRTHSMRGVPYPADRYDMNKKFYATILSKDTDSYGGELTAFIAFCQEEKIEAVLEQQVKNSNKETHGDLKVEAMEYTEFLDDNIFRMNGLLENMKNNTGTKEMILGCLHRSPLLPPTFLFFAASILPSLSSGAPITWPHDSYSDESDMATLTGILKQKLLEYTSTFNTSLQHPPPWPPAYCYISRLAEAIHEHVAAMCDKPVTMNQAVTSMLFCILYGGCDFFPEMLCDGCTWETFMESYIAYTGTTGYENVVYNNRTNRAKKPKRDLSHLVRRFLPYLASMHPMENMEHTTRSFIAPCTFR